jgi:hypothetical protein
MKYVLKTYFMTKTKNPRNAGRKQKGLYKKGINGPISTTAIPYGGIYTIYGLAASNEPEIVKYVGYTSMMMNERYNNHKSEAKRNRTPKEKWIKCVLEEGHKLIMIVLEDSILARTEAFAKEKQYIKELRNTMDAEPGLTNVTEGGPGICGMTHSEETKKKQREANLGRMVTEVTIEKRKTSVRNRKERAHEVIQNKIN